MLRWAICHNVKILQGVGLHEVQVFLNEQIIVSVDTAENVAVPLPVLNTELDICNVQSTLC